MHKKKAVMHRRMSAVISATAISHITEFEHVLQRAM